MPNLDPDKKRLVASILHFLRREFRLGYLSEENKEGLEVAIQCIETVYEVGNSTETEPPLLDIFKAYLSTSILNKPESSEQDKKEAEKLKTEGNSAMNSNLFSEAIALYTKAISHDPKNAVYYCNRAAAHSKLHNYTQAIVDCKIAIEIDPSYSKAYGRLGLAYCGLEDYLNALDNYKKALQLEPSNDSYRKNYELALMKVNEFRYGRTSPNDIVGNQNNQDNGRSNVTPEGNSRPPPNSGNPPSEQPGMNNLGPGQVDLSSLFGNPQLMRFANQMLADPNMQNMMSAIMNGTLNSEGGRSRIGVDDILQVGQQLAQHMQSEHPSVIEEIRQAFETQINDDGNPTPTPPGQPDNKKGGPGDKK
ncbi:small glutamine-rich tetratricopeptide repeat-containing protein alpha-like isoform X2 [Cimex lectularius]|uniref:SGTA homodimerisation domain-containing protein n=1 Tax=Cimex lectularius TaxID=79782 RepID=A0A8I6RJB6_CIMLE|nr:small glutamine-rich tetratricopeptide repeat-containing protein alpha-like isoform X2 [Cimex lectularius]